MHNTSLGEEVMTIGDVIARFRVGVSDSAEFMQLMQTAHDLGYPTFTVDEGVWEITVSPDSAYHIAARGGAYRLISYP